MQHLVLEGKTAVISRGEQADKEAKRPGKNARMAALWSEGRGHMLPPLATPKYVPRAPEEPALIVLVVDLSRSMWQQSTGLFKAIDALVLQQQERQQEPDCIEEPWLEVVFVGGRPDTERYSSSPNLVGRALAAHYGRAPRTALYPGYFVASPAQPLSRVRILDHLCHPDVPALMGSSAMPIRSALCGLTMRYHARRNVVMAVLANAPDRNSRPHHSMALLGERMRWVQQNQGWRILCAGPHYLRRALVPPACKLEPYIGFDAFESQALTAAIERLSDALLEARLHFVRQRIEPETSASASHLVLPPLLL